VGRPVADRTAYSSTDVAISSRRSGEGESTKGTRAPLPLLLTDWAGDAARDDVPKRAVLSATAAEWFPAP